MKAREFNAGEPDFFKETINYIRTSLQAYKIDSKMIRKTELVCEEILIQLKKQLKDNTDVAVRVKRSFGGIDVELEAEGNKIESLEQSNIDAAINMLESENETDISSLILKAYGEQLNYIYKDGMNKVRVQTCKREHSTVYITLFALVLALVVGLGCRNFLPQVVNDGIIKYCLSPIKTIFLNALKIVVGPVVFFSIITCISQFSSLSELGKIGGKVMGLYMCTTILAVCVGFGMFALIDPGQWQMALDGSVQTAEVAVNTEVDTSLLGTLINIVPSNLFKPFVESNTLQIIFLAVLLGAAVGMIGRYTKVLQEILEACNELFLTVTKIIAKFIPLAVFCAVSLMIIQTGTDSLLAMLSMALTDVAALIVMIILYGVIILVFARINPINFYKKDWQGMVTSFSLSSSSAAMPTNMQICTEKLGISPKVCGFSIPLGATINMDGTSIHLAVCAMFLAKVYGVPVPGSAMVSIVITILMLSLGTPGVPGAALVCLGILLNQIGVPIEAVGLVMGVDSLLDMFRTASNTTGDMAVSLIVAKSEGLLDMDVYNSK